MHMQQSGLKSYDEYWLGLTDHLTEGRFVWVDGTPLVPELANWRDGETRL